METCTIAPVTKLTTLLAGSILILIAVVFACAVALLVIPGVQMLPRYRIGAEDILPAKETVLLLHDPSAKELQQWKTIFPALDDVISDAVLDAVAVVKSPEGEMQSVGFIKKSGAWDGKSCDIGPYQVVFAVPGRFPCRAIDTFLAPGSRLAQDRGWKSLGRLPKESWAFLRREEVPVGKTLPERALQASLLGGATHLLFPEEKDVIVIRAWPTSPLSPLAEPSIISPLRDPAMVLTVGNLEEMLGGLDHVLSPEDHIIFEGSLLQMLEELAGPQVSLRYEILPLIARGSQIHTGKTASGTQSILLSGNADHTKDIVTRIDALHRSFALRHPDVELLEYAFDDGRFPFQTLRLSEEVSSEASDQIRGWAVVISRDGIDNAMLITAVNGRKTAISNDPELLRKFLMEEGKIISLSQTKRPLVSRMVAGMLIPNKWLGSAPLWIPEAGESVVSMEQTGDVRTVRVVGMHK